MEIRFGTDGLRGAFGQAPIDLGTAWRLGRALSGNEGPILVARDSRESGHLLASALIAGILDGGGAPRDLGILPTPALSVALARGLGRLGVMVTASHNPPGDNGFKLMGPDGRKLDDAAQAAIERVLSPWRPEPAPPPTTRRGRDEESLALYRSQVLARVPPGSWLAPHAIVVDAASGAASETLPHLVEALGGAPILLNCQPDGARINLGSGALHPEALAALVVSRGAAAGVALDGDGDRCVMVSSSGRVLDGDALLFLLARGPAVVGTLMTNAGLEHSLGARGIALHRTPVGDRHVEEALRKHGLHVGAEPSGHVCFDDGLPTADGALTALRVLVGGLDLDARLQGYRPWPSLLRNLRVARRPPLDAPGPLADARREAELAVTPGGRVILRYSGTEPRLRVLVEGPDEAIVAAVSSTLVSTLERLTGEP